MYKTECAEDVITSNKLSHFEARLAIFLFVRTDWENLVRMSQAEISQAMHVPASQISRTIKKLINRGIIRSQSKGVFEVNPRYFFMGEDDEREYAIKDRGHLFPIQEEETV
jgi:DNA-binding IclR family transcriptional regulator